MYASPIPPRNDRAAAVAARAPAAATPRSPVAKPPDDPAVDAQHDAFDQTVAERAELMREEEALGELMMEFLKNEDEIMKKWIAMI
jgi:hypothetical protein